MKLGFGIAAAMLAMSAFASTTAFAGDDYPSHPVKIIVPFAPGGANDVLARILGEELQKRLGKPFIVDNRPGANGNVGMAVAAAAPADGYTLVLTTAGTWAVNPHLYKSNFDVVKNFEPIMNVTFSPGVLAVFPGLPVKSVQELIEYGKANPKRLTYGSAGIGGFGHISGVMFSMMTGTPMTHVPYRGAGPAQIAAVSGEVQVLFNDILSTMQLLNDGRLRALAVTSKDKVKLLPNTPTVGETVPGFENSTWTGLAAPAGTPAPIVAKLNKEIREVLQDPSTQQRIEATGATIVGSSPEEFAALLKSEIAKYGRIVHDANITLEGKQ